MLFYNFETGAVAIGEPIYTPDDYYDEPGPYTFQPYSHKINYTFAGPFKPGVDANDANVQAYINALLRAQYWALLVAYGYYVPPNAFGCVDG